MMKFGTALRYSFLSVSVAMGLLVVRVSHAKVQRPLPQDREEVMVRAPKTVLHFQVCVTAKQMKTANTALTSKPLQTRMIMI